MIPAAFAYHCPTSLQEALQLLAAHPDDARVLAGGHSLLPAMKLRLAQPATVIDISRLTDLAYIREEGDELVIGALATHRQIEASDLVRRWAAGLQECAATIGDPQVRNRGTIGGGLAHADPAADYPGILLALDAQFILQGSGGQRLVRAANFFRGPFTTALAAGELLTEVRIPRPAPMSGSAYVKLARRASDFALVGAGAYVALAGGTFAAVRIGITGAAAAPFRAGQMETALQGASASAEAVAAAAARAAAGVEMMGDATVSADYRGHVTGVYARRALDAALRRAQGG